MSSFQGRRRYLTLIELLLVLAILGSALGWIGIQIGRTVREQRFRAEVATVVQQLRLAQDLCLSFQQNAIVRFIVAEGSTGIQMSFVFDTPLPGLWNQELVKRPKQLTAIHFLDFSDELTFPASEKNGTDVKFLSGGSVVSRGIMHLATSESRNVLGALERYICLPGYPAFIDSVASEVEAQACLKKDMVPDELLTTKTMEEIQTAS